jgi:hypothetical protein
MKKSMRTPPLNVADMRDLDTDMRDLHTIDSELRFHSAMRRSICSDSRDVASRQIDLLLDERNELTKG